MKFSNGDFVEVLPSFRCEVDIAGKRGIVCGVATQEQPVVGHLMIVEICVPNHPWDCIVIPEIHLEKV